MSSPSHLRRDRILFHVGIVLLLVGAPGLLVGTLLHDPLEVSVIGTAYDGFGWINETFLGIGVLLTVIGAAFVVLALRGGVIADEKIEREESGGSGT